MQPNILSGPRRRKVYNSRTKAKWEQNRQKPKPGNLDISRRRADYRRAIEEVGKECLNKLLYPKERAFNSRSGKKLFYSAEKGIALKRSAHELIDSNIFSKFLRKQNTLFEVVNVKSTPKFCAQQYHGRPSLKALELTLEGGHPIPKGEELILAQKFIKIAGKNGLTKKNLRDLIENIDIELCRQFDMFYATSTDFYAKYYPDFSISNVLALGFNPKTRKLKIAIIDL
ncbi:MAG: hypothetical protein NTY48_07115 [Candidatus Diapherotrites archaeon]|nr:hypothetical protein [Candidatus Diapherotrites archaeon]